MYPQPGIPHPNNRESLIRNMSHRHECTIDRWDPQQAERGSCCCGFVLPAPKSSRVTPRSVLTRAKMSSSLVESPLASQRKNGRRPRRIKNYAPHPSAADSTEAIDLCGDSDGDDSNVAVVARAARKRRRQSDEVQVIDVAAKGKSDPNERIQFDLTAAEGLQENMLKRWRVSGRGRSADSPREDDVCVIADGLSVLKSPIKGRSLISGALKKAKAASVSDCAITGVLPPPPPLPKPLTLAEQVLLILPDVDINHLDSILRSNNNDVTATVRYVLVESSLSTVHTSMFGQLTPRRFCFSW
jgi:hypothetical protein